MFLFIKSKPEHGGWCSHSRVIKMLKLISFTATKKSRFHELTRSKHTEESDNKQFKQPKQVGTERKHTINIQPNQPEPKLQEECLFTGCRVFPLPAPAPGLSPATKPAPHPAAVSPPWNHWDGFLSLKRSAGRKAVKTCSKKLRVSPVCGRAFFNPVFMRSRCRREMYSNSFYTAHRNYERKLSTAAFPNKITFRAIYTKFPDYMLLS